MHLESSDTGLGKHGPKLDRSFGLFGRESKASGIVYHINMVHINQASTLPGPMITVSSHLGYLFVTYYESRLSVWDLGFRYRYRPGQF